MKALLLTLAMMAPDEAGSFDYHVHSRLGKAINRVEAQFWLQVQYNQQWLRQWRQTGSRAYILPSRFNDWTTKQVGQLEGFMEIYTGKPHRLKKVWE